MNEENYIAFEDYLNNEMQPEAKIDFENKLQSDNDFNQNFEVYKETTSFLETKFDPATFDFKQNLKSISQNSFSENNEVIANEKTIKVIAFKPWQYAVAACVTLFIGSLFFMQNSNPNYTDFNQHEEAYLTERGATSKNLKEAQDAFNAKKYEVALPLFESVLKVDSRPEVQYFYGICLLESNKINQANVIFQKLKFGKSIYRNKAIWNLALAQLKQKNYKVCKEILLSIPKDYEEYDKVEKLLKKLN